jgi:hypothetical protein
MGSDSFGSGQVCLECRRRFFDAVVHSCYSMYPTTFCWHVAGTFLSSVMLYVVCFSTLKPRLFFRKSKVSRRLKFTVPHTNGRVRLPLTLLHIEALAILVICVFCSRLE